MELVRNKYEEQINEICLKWEEEFYQLLNIEIEATRLVNFECLFEILHTETIDCVDGINEIISKKIKKNHISYKPWYNEEIINLHKRQKALHDKYLETGILKYEDKSKEIVKVLRKHMRDAESKYLRRQMFKLDDLRYLDSKKFWAIIDRKINPKAEVETELQKLAKNLVKSLMKN
jgi:uncharacterized protein YdhG (YjbR/CyaY superfamily)